MVSTKRNRRANRHCHHHGRIPSKSLPPDPLTNLARMAAVKAQEAAEAYFTLGHFDYAIKQARAAKELDPDLLGMDNYMTAYQVHSAVSHNKIWYHVLGIPNPSVADSESIKKQYKRLALALHPDKNRSIAADGAFKSVKAAWDVLSDPAKKEAYDKSLRRFQGDRDFYSCKAASSSARSASCRPAQQQTSGASARKRACKAASSSARSASCKPAQQQTSGACARKRAGPDANTTEGDRGFYRKIITIEKSNPGQKATVTRLSVCRVA